MEWLRERSAYYSAGRPTFDRMIQNGVDPVRAEAEAIIAEFEHLHGTLPPKQREDGIKAAIAQIEKRNRGY